MKAYQYQDTYIYNSAKMHFSALVMPNSAEWNMFFLTSVILSKLAVDSVLLDSCYNVAQHI